MEIIIAGAGRVGFRLAKSLSEKHNVIIMDKNTEALLKIQESLDVLTISGDIEDPNSYESLLGKEIDIFIAVTDVDEINLICCIIASEKMQVQRKIIRLRNEFFAHSSVAQKIGITDAVFPFALTAKSVVSLLDFPKANNVKSYKQTDHVLISFKMDNPKESFIKVLDIETPFVKVVGIDSQKEFFTPTIDTVAKNGDMVYLFGKEEYIRPICSRFNHAMPKKIKNIVIFGADILGREIARALSSHKTNIKLVEKNLVKCNEASEMLQNNVTIINSKYGDFRLYDDEVLKSMRFIRSWRLLVQIQLSMKNFFVVE